MELWQSWKIVPDRSFHIFLKALNERFARNPFVPNDTVIQFQTLSFYGSYKLMRAITGKKGDARREACFLYRSGVQGGQAHLVLLEGGADAVETVNRKSPILLGPTNVIHYVHYYLTAVADEKRGPVHFIDDVEKLDFAENMAEKDVQAIKDAFDAPQRTGSRDAGFTVTACVLYGGALRKASFNVDKNGGLEWASETVLVDNIAGA